MVESSLLLINLTAAAFRVGHLHCWVFMKEITEGREGTKRENKSLLRVLSSLRFDLKSTKEAHTLVEQLLASIWLMYSRVTVHSIR